MNKKKVLKYVKILITVAIVFSGIYFLALHPYIEFRKNEKIMKEAAERYYYLNPDKLPTGERINTLTLKDLYRGAYIKKDIYLPYSKEPCSINNSWVKVRNVNNEYKYYTYLECGALKSSVDHVGPNIELNGNDEITIYNGEEYKEEGVKSVSDATDGKMDIKDVTIDSSKVDTKKNGTYNVTYTASDMFNNKSVKIRKVTVIETLNHVTKKLVEKDGYVKGNPENNNVLLSGIEFKIISRDGNNVRLVTADDISNVNYSGIEEWLDYFYSNITNEAKEYIVKSKYCNDTIKESKIDKTTTCSSTTDKKSVYILSVQDMKNSVDKDGESFLYPTTISWLANATSKANAITTRNFFNNTDSKFMTFDKKYNFGVRPVITIKGDSQITAGDGTIDNPYVFGETETGKAGEYINTRHAGEYINYSNYNFRIIGTEEDGTTKVILDSVIPAKTNYNKDKSIAIYNPKEKDNVGYQINKLVGEYINGKYFVTHQISVPIYKNEALYKKETKNVNYKVKYSAPNMYDLFSASKSDFSSYWLINSSNLDDMRYIVSDIGVIYYEPLGSNMYANIRFVSYLDKNVLIVSGKGTRLNPYKITK